ncbi:MAG: hypothetical protein II912_10655 [Clostridia bacterium]|nr:hypothetical protein [Clostridia bacterium]
MTRKRFFAAALALLMLLGILPGLRPAAQATASYGEHTHKWVATDRLEPTCTDSGVVYEYCSVCQADRERTLPPLGHHFPPEKWEVTKQPTCTEPGQEMNHCTRVNYGRVCGYEWRRELPPLGHDWGEWYVFKPAAPGDPGIEERKCSRCGLTHQRLFYVGEDPDEVRIILNVTIANKQPTYLEGESIPYVYEITNISDIPLYIQYVYYLNPDGTYGATDGPRGATVPPGETRYFYDDVYQVKKSDIEDYSPTFVRRFELFAYRSASDASQEKDRVKSNGYVYVDAHIGDAALADKLFLDATLIVPQPYYLADDEALFNVSITNNSDEKITVEDTWIRLPSGNSYDYWDIQDLEAGETQSFVLDYMVEQNEIDLSAGEMRIEFQCFGGPSKADLGDLPYIYSNIDVCMLPLGEEDIGDMELIVEKTIKGVDEYEAYPSYTEGEVVTFCIDVSNAQDYPLYDVVITDRDSYGSTVELDSFAVFGPHESKHYELTYTVTAEDCVNGLYENTAIGEWYSREEDIGVEEKNLIDDTVTVETWYEQGDMELYITKEEISAPLNGSFYTEGETVICQIDAWNCQPYPLYNVTVDDRDEEGILPLYFGDLAPHQTVHYEVTHTIEASDIERGYYENTAYGRWQSDDDEDGDIWEITDTVRVPVGKPADEVTVIKQETSVPANGLYYVEGEDVTYTVFITNNTGSPIYDIKLYDELLDETQDYEVSALPIKPGQTFEVQYSHTVTQLDVLAGYIVNVAKVSWSQRDVTLVGTVDRSAAWTNEVTVLTGGEPPVPNPGKVTLTKAEVGGPDNGSYYEVGEEILFLVTITNDGGYTVENVQVDDPIFPDAEDIVLEKGFDLGPGESRGYFVHYHATQEDADDGWALNEAEARYYDPVLGKKVDIYSNTILVPVGQPGPEPSVKLSKMENSFPINGMFYREGEDIEYRFVLTNDSDEPIHYVGIYDPLHEVGGEIAPIYKTSVLGPHESVECFFTYTVTKDDVDNLTDIINQGLAEYYPDPEGEDHTVFSNTVITPIGKDVPPDPEEPYIDMSVTKTAVNAPANGKWYVEGENVGFLITFTNKGDVPLYLTDYIDEVFNDNGSASTTVPLSDQVVTPYSSATFFYPYWVTKDDADSGYMRNEVEFWAWTEVDPYGRIDCYPYAEITVQTGPGPEPVPPLAAYKYETSTPKNGWAYTEGEQVEYDIVLYNPGSRVYKDVESYDILLVDVPGFWLNYHEKLDSAPIVEHVAYLVTEADVTIGYIYNIGWFTMEDEDGNVITVYSNELIVQTTDKTDPPQRGGRTCCEYVLAAEGEGAASYTNDFCLEHSMIEATVQKLLKDAEDGQAEARAWARAQELWQRSLDAEYERLIKAADGDLKTALENDRLVFKAYLEALKARLEAEEPGTADIDKTLAELLRDRTCELCSTFGHAPKERRDLSGKAAHEQARVSASICGVDFASNGSVMYTKALNVCDRHLPLVKAAGRVLAAAGEDEELLTLAWTRADAIWLSALDGQYSDMAKEASPMLKHLILKEQASVNAFIRVRTELYALLYPDSAAAVKELSAELKKQAAMALCQ